MSLAKQTQNTFDLTPSTDIYVIGWNDYNAQNIKNTFKLVTFDTLDSHTNTDPNFTLTQSAKTIP